jgi:hypothetical protein
MMAVKKMSETISSGFQLFSKSPDEMQIEMNFARRLLGFVQSLDVIDLHQWAVSGEFDKIFHQVDEEMAPLEFTKFENLKPFDYQDWAKRNKVKD